MLPLFSPEKKKGGISLSPLTRLGDESLNRKSGSDNPVVDGTKSGKVPFFWEERIKESCIMRRALIQEIRICNYILTITSFRKGKGNEERQEKTTSVPWLCISTKPCSACRHVFFRVLVESAKESMEVFLREWTGRRSSAAGPTRR